MVLMKKTTQHLRHTYRSSRDSYLASTLIRDLQGQLQVALTLPGTPQRQTLVGGHNARRVATISTNLNTRSAGAAKVSINPARHTSKANASGRGGYNRYLVGKIQ